MGEAFKRQVKRIQESWFVVILGTLVPTLSTVTPNIRPGFLFEYWFEILITILSLILVKLLVDRLLSNFLDRIYSWLSTVISFDSREFFNRQT